MAITAQVSQKELERVAGVAYEGRAIRVSLANDISDSLTANSPVSSYTALKVNSGNGYEDYLGTIGEGQYNVLTTKYELPSIDASFTATGAGYSYNKVYVVLGTYTNFVISETSLTGNVATITTVSNHTITAGDFVRISGASNSVYNGYYTVLATPSATRFTYALVSGNISSAASTGTASLVNEEDYVHSVITEAPPITLLSGQLQTYRVALATDD